jgi:hypothetical protein
MSVSLSSVETCMRSSGEVIISVKEFYTRRQDIAKIVSIQEIFITKREKHESLEFRGSFLI